MKNFVFTFLTFTISLNCYTQTFQKLFEGNGNTIGYAIELTTDGYLLAGSTHSAELNDKEVYIVQSNKYGDILSSQVIGGNDDDEAYSMVKTLDGGFILAGYTLSFVNTPSDSCNAYLIKLDSDYSIEWSKSYGGDSIDVAYSVCQTSDSGFVVTGFTKSDEAGNEDLMLFKTDKKGMLLWSNLFGTSGRDIGRSVIENSAGDIIVAGYTDGTAVTGWIFNALRVNALGELVWSHAYDFTGVDDKGKERFAHSVIESDDLEYMIAGNLGKGDIDNSEPALIKIDNNGNILWRKSYQPNTGDCGVRSIQKTTDGGYILGGYMGNYLPLLIKIDSEGQILWDHAFSGIDGKGYSVKQTSKGGYILLGQSIETDTSMYVIKTDMSGKVCYSYDLMEGYVKSWVAGRYDYVLEDTSYGYEKSAISHLESVTSVVNEFCKDSLDFLVIELEVTGFNCHGESDNGSIDLTIIRGEEPYDFEWSNGSTTEDIEGLENGTYSVTVTDADGTIAIDSITIDEVEPMVTDINIENELLCYGDNEGALTAKVSGGNPPYSYQWDNYELSNDSTAWNLSADSIYHVIVSDQNNCTAIDSGSLSQPPKIITSNITGKTEVVVKELTNYYVTDTEGSVYNWISTGGSIISAQDSSLINIEWVEQGTGSVTVIETDSNGCKGDTVKLAVTIGPYEMSVFQDTIWICHQWWPLNHACGTGMNIDFDRYKNPIIYSQLSNNIWQIGPTTKFALTSSPYKRSLVTDTVNPYPKNSYSELGITIIGNFYGDEAITFIHKYDTDPYQDGGKIEFYNRLEKRWQNIIEPNYLIHDKVNVYSKNDTVTALDNSPGFSGSIDWEEVLLFLSAPGIDTIDIKFTFASDSIDNKKDGWIIDDIVFVSRYEGISNTTYNPIDVFPNPFSNTATIEFPNQSMDEYNLYIIDVSGKICKIINEISTSEYILERGNLQPGLYFIELQGPNIYRGKIIVE